MANRHSTLVRMLALIFTVSSHAYAHDEAVEAALEAMLVNPTHTSVPGTHLHWSNPATWVGRNVPGNGSTVLIPAGSGVDFDGDTARISWIKVRGRLGISATPLSGGGLGAGGVLNSVAMTIRVETLVVDDSGEALCWAMKQTGLPAR